MPRRSETVRAPAERSKVKNFVLNADKFDVSLDVKKFPSNYPAFVNEKVCLFCMTQINNPDEFGSFIHHKQSGIWIHYFCLLLACGLEQKCKDSDIDVMETGHSIYGFLIKDILKEFKRASRLKCNFCYKPGATIGCCVKKCKSKFHFNCGLNHNVLYQYFGSFRSYCKSHKPIQNHLSQSNISGKKIIPKPCCMCLEMIMPSSDAIEAPCCKTTWSHKNCAQRQALSAGHYYFRCPACNNKEEYTNEMLRLGIYVPDRDASWETPDAYLDLLGRGIRCDIDDCKCTQGRKYDSTGTKWAIVACIICGASGSHVFCSSLKSADSPFVCEICFSTQGRHGVRKALLQLGFKAEELLQLPLNELSKDKEKRDKKVTRLSLKRKIDTTSPKSPSRRRKTTSLTPLAKLKKQS